MNNNVIIPLLISTVAGLSTVIGGLIVYLKINRVEEFISFCLSFSLSVMISISIIELLPESIFQIIRYFGILKGLILSIIIFLIGMLLVNTINKKINSDKNISPTNNRLYRVGILSMIALMIHNFPEGIATFMSSYKDITLGINLALAIMMHNIPEGISISVPIYYSTGSKKRGVGYSLLSGFAEPLGAILTYILFKEYINDLSLAFILILVAGIMVTLSINELLPESLKYNKNKYILYGLVVGVALVIINHFIL